MKDIYELKANKYILKYLRLLQEIVGGVKKLPLTPELQNLLNIMISKIEIIHNNDKIIFKTIRKYDHIDEELFKKIIEYTVIISNALEEVTKVLNKTPLNKNKHYSSLLLDSPQLYNLHNAHNISKNLLDRIYSIEILNERTLIDINDKELKILESKNRTEEEKHLEEEIKILKKYLVDYHKDISDVSKIINQLIFNLDSQNIQNIILHDLYVFEHVNR
jgi:hypothetical protein